MKKIRRFFAKPFRWGCFYGCILTLAAAWVLLDGFVIPRQVQVIEPPAQASAESKISSISLLPDRAEMPSSSSSNLSASEYNEPSALPEPAPAGFTENGYQDENLQLTITTAEYYDTTVYLAEIQLKDASLLKTAFAQNAYGQNLRETTSEMAEAHNAIFAINGDYYGFRKEGFVLRGGTLYRDIPRRSGEILIFYSDGNLEIVEEAGTTGEQLIGAGAKEVFSFGPSLLVDGEITVSPTDEVGMAKTSNPRTAFGMIEPLHYLAVVSDGRTEESAGLSLYQLAQVMQEAGCRLAYNLDGGGSSTMWFHGEVVNNPTSGRKIGERRVSDIVYLGYE